jgi:O-antigen ligase
MKYPLSLIFACLTIILLPAYVVRFQIAGIPTTLLEISFVATFLVWLSEVWPGGEGLGAFYEKIKSPIFLPGAALLGLALVACFWSVDVKAGLGLWRAYFLEPFLLSLILVELARRTGEARVFIWSLIASGIWVAFIAIAQIHLQLFIFPDAVHEVIFGRAAAVYNTANALALYLGPIIALTAGLAVWSSKYYVIPLGILAWGFYLSHSHGGQIALGAAALFLIMGFLWPRISSGLRRAFWRGLPYLLGAVVALIFVVIANINSFTPLARSLAGSIIPDTGLVRICLWEGTTKLLEAKPILGSGMASFPKVYPSYVTCNSEPLQYPHNLLLAFWTELGILGPVIFLWLLWRILSQLRLSEDKMSALIITSAFVYIFIHGLVDQPYFKNDLSMEFWTLAGLALVVRERKLHLS